MKKLSIVAALLISFTLFLSIGACRKGHKDLERPDIDMADVNLVFSANSDENQVFAYILASYTMSFNGLIITMYYNLATNRFEGEIQNLSDKTRTIIVLYAKYNNGHQSSVVNDIVLKPNETYKLIQVLDNEHSFKMWQPYVEIELTENEDPKPPSVSISVF